MKTALYMLLLGAALNARGQGIRDTVVKVKDLMTVKIMNRDPDEYIKDDYILIDVENTSGKTFYFTDTRGSLSCYEKDFTEYIVFGDAKVTVGSLPVELVQVPPHGRLMRMYMLPNNEKGIIINYLPEEKNITEERKKYYISSTSYNKEIRQAVIRLIP